MAEEETPSIAPASLRPLEPTPSGDRMWLKWLVGLLGVNAAGMGWMAVREGSPPAICQVMDAFFQFGTGSLAAYVAYRVLVRFSFRIFDLLVIVLLLGLGIRFTLDALTSFAQFPFLWEGRVNANESLGSVMQICLISTSVHLVGAALGLRYCAKLKLDRTLGRAWAVVSGMLLLPCTAGAVGFPILIVRDLIGFRYAEKVKQTGPGGASWTREYSLEPSEQHETLLLYFVLAVASFLILASNSYLLVRSLAHEEEVRTGSKVP